MTEVTLQKILDAREKRVAKQKDILCRYNFPLISFTMNIAGPIKNTPLIERSFFEGIRLLKERLPKNSIIHQETTIEPTGCEAIFSVNYETQKLKTICTSIEESVSIGRLFDMDVIDTNGEKLEREIPRACLVCGASGRVCSAGRLHSVNELWSVTNAIMEDYFFEIDAEYYATLSKKSLLDEVYTTPKPGLVDTRNNGSHADMDITTFEKSANALKSYFGDCFSIGKNTSHLSPEETFPLLKKAGITAEQTMYNATGGVNTHKGAIYSLGILCAGAGRLWTGATPFMSVDKLCQECAKIVKSAVEKDFKTIDETTAGGKLYLKYGFGGIRSEVASGFDSVINTSLPVYKSLIKKGFTENDAGAITLLHLIANVKDTNLYHRGGIHTAEEAQERVKDLLEKILYPKKEQIELLDNFFIEKNLSPGGCADLLAVTYFLYEIDSQKN